MSVRAKGRRIAAWTVVGVVLVAVVGWFGAIGASNASAQSDESEDPVLVVGHRGASAFAPEHTGPAYDRAVRAGVDVLECDLQLSADEQLVCVHDTTVDRTTGGTHLGRVDQYTLAQLREMDFGTWFGPEFAGASIVTLEEQLTCYRGIDPSMQFYLETKSPSEYGGRMEPLLVNLLGRLGLVPKGEPDVRTSPVIIQSFDPSSLAAVHELAPSLPTALLTFAAPAADVTTIVDPHAVLPGAGVLAVQPEIITTAHAEGREVHTWTVDDPTIMRSLIESGIDGFFTDDPATARETVDAMDRGSGRESQPEPSAPEEATATTTEDTTATEVERARGCPVGMGVGFVAAADRARSEEATADDGVSPVVPIAITAGLLIVAGVGGTLLVRRRRARS